jgi:hypothetical protein
MALKLNKAISTETREKNRLRSKLHYHNNVDYYKKWCRENVASRLVSIAKTRARLRNVEFSINKNDIELPTHCPILGIKLEYNQGTGAGGKDNSYSLDRIDPTKGYILGNIWVISHKANSMKFTANKEELLLFADWIYKEYSNAPRCDT